MLSAIVVPRYTFVRRLSTMKVTPFVVTYNGMATGPSIKRCVEYLMTDAPSTFGAAIEQVDVYAHCQTTDLIADSFADMNARFQVRLATLPLLRFKRKSCLLEVSYASQILHSDAMFESSSGSLLVAEFNCLCREFAGVLSLARRRLTRSDAFDIDSLDSHLRNRLALLSEDA